MGCDMVPPPALAINDGQKPVTTEMTGSCDSYPK